MQQTKLLYLFIIFTTITFSQTTPIPDVNFENKLIDYDIQGRKILQTIPINNHISIAHLNNGIYFLNIETDGKMATQKIIKN